MFNPYTLNSLTHTVAEDIDGVRGAAIIDLELGLALADQSNSTISNMDLVGGHYAVMLKKKLRTLTKLGSTSRLETIVMSYENETHIISVVDSESFLLTVAEPDADPITAIDHAIDMAHAPAFEYQAA
ncbi:hypothetical protein [Corynebacterium cystitidis]|uniref:hypothetical protein n=1 Tax=Corynebacterium cystitidis TaxID=35757 RepID=UPI00211E3731|nr:hypothetical protein [Corynebacterium cystitidis]